ncbi:Bublin coiled-coil protein [Labeo rohita]|uniref:Bublin coiled-coil protein n=2 Tax=Labeo rohita TaxID=84645 RepID=A0ABQ8MQJ5_LABRO|nr:Bublin coiled-coil protein [Labeo rohita]
MSGPNGDPNISVDDGIIEDEDEFNEEEYAAIDSMLDQINSCLDNIEERNEALNGKLHELRREFREQLNDEEQQQPPHPPPPPDEDSESTDTKTED